MAVIITMPLIREELQITHAQAGMLLSIITASYGLIQFPSGILSDTFNNKKLLIMVTFSLVLALMGVSFSQDLLPFALSLLLTGLFVGFKDVSKENGNYDGYLQHRALHGPVFWDLYFRRCSHHV